MQCATIKNGVECSFMAKKGCSFIGGACRPVEDKCVNCDRIVEVAGTKYCQAFPDPQAKWRRGECSMATHIKADAKGGADAKVRVGQQKQKKK
jgi:hypothetical protein